MTKCALRMYLIELSRKILEYTYIMNGTNLTHIRDKERLPYIKEIVRFCLMDVYALKKIGIEQTKKHIFRYI